MFFERIYERGLAQASYLVGCQATGEAIVIDPKRDIDDYVTLARREGLRIRKVTETHIHADFLSGSRELAAATGAELLLSDEGGADWQYEFPHTSLRRGEHFMVGNLKFEVLHTPGHTPEHICFLLTDTPAGTDPVMLFTGDFVFVGDVGRPDLLEKAAGIAGTMTESAQSLWRSLALFRALPDHLQMWPGHGAGSACGKALGAVPGSTVGYEKLVNWAFQAKDEASFVATILDGQPEPPTYFAMMKRLNRVERPLFEKKTLAVLEPEELEARMRKGAVLADLRSKQAFLGGHIPGALFLPFSNAFTTWAGWVIPYDRPIILSVDARMADEAVVALSRIGLDKVVALAPDVDTWEQSGRRLALVDSVEASDLAHHAQQTGAMILDVRGAAEFAEARIAGSKRVHFGNLRRHLDELPKDRPLAVHCKAGGRSLLACSILQSEGYESVRNVSGGIDAWMKHGGAVEPGADEHVRDRVSR